MNLIWIAILSVTVLAVLVLLAYAGYEDCPAIIEILLFVLTAAVFIFTVYAIGGAYGEIVWMLGFAERVV